MCFSVVVLSCLSLVLGRLFFLEVFEALGVKQFYGDYAFVASTR